MRFISSVGTRPVRLKQSTREFAWESMHGKYGDEAIKYDSVSMDSVKDFEKMEAYRKYDCIIENIVKNAPLRICENELVHGAATLGLAISHVIPARWNGKPVYDSISHLTLGFYRVLEIGVDGLENMINKKLAEKGLDQKQIIILNSMKNTIAAMHIWHERYLHMVEKTDKAAYELMKYVPFKAPQSFHEALQSLWFTFAFTRLCGNWSGIGRIDEMLGRFLKADLESGKETIDSAREKLASLFIKGCEWIQSDTPVGSGDAQHYQNIVLAGIDINGKQVANEVTYLVLDVVEELGISDFPITVRINRQTPQKLLRRVAEVIRLGGGIVAIYNEPLILESMTSFGYDPIQARRFANDGCWETQIPGETYFIYHPFDSLQILLNETLHLNTDCPKSFASYNDLEKEFFNNLNKTVTKISDDIYKYRFESTENGVFKWNDGIPCSVVSLFTGGCIENARSYYGGGPNYTVYSPHIGGAPDVGNSLYAIDKLVFKEKKVTFEKLMHILQTNWEGEERLRQYALNELTYYGNDCDESDSYTARVLNTFADFCLQFRGRCPVMLPAGVSTFGRQIEWSPKRFAVPFGKKQGEYLAANDSPTPGTEIKGITSVIKSYCKADLKKQTTGAALDLKIYPSSVKGENGLTAIISLINGFIELGGYFMQIDVVDKATLLDAQQHPENYKTLSVRVSGWNARFITLDRQWQQTVIDELGRHE